MGHHIAVRCITIEYRTIYLKLMPKSAFINTLQDAHGSITIMVMPIAIMFRLRTAKEDDMIHIVMVLMEIVSFSL